MARSGHDSSRKVPRFFRRAGEGIVTIAFEGVAELVLSGICLLAYRGLRTLGMSANELYLAWIAILSVFVVVTGIIALRARRKIRARRNHMGLASINRLGLASSRRNRGT